MRWKTLLILAAVVVVLLAAGAWLGTALPAADAERFAAGSPEREVARRALDTARWFIPESLGPLAPLALSTQLVEVRRVPGSCTQMPAAGTDWEPVADYVALVRARTLFGIPLRSYEVTCGGAAIRVN